MKNKLKKKILCLSTFCLLAISLFACSSNKGTAYGELTDAAYFKQGDYTLSEKQLYNQMLTHKTGSSFTFIETLNKMVNQKVLATYIDEVNQKWSAEYLDKAKDLVEKEIYGTDDDEKIGKIASSTKKVQLKKFLDSQISKGINATDIYDEKILEGYKYQFATEIFAKKLLAIDTTQEFLKDEDGEITDDKNPNFITEDSVKSYYENNYKGKNDFSVIVVKFTNLNEAEEYFKNYTAIYNGITYKGLKSYKNELYLVPSNTNFDTIIDEGNIQNYLNFSSINGGKDLLIVFVELYRELFSYSSKITQSDIDSLKNSTFAQIIETLSTNEKFKDFQKNYEDFSKSDSAISSYVATKLKVENEEGKEVLPRYTSTSKSFSGTYYYMYKITDGTDKELNDELKAEITQKLIDEKAASAYINEKLAAITKKLTLTIFDGNIQNVYKVLNPDYKVTGKKNDTLLCKIDIEEDEDLFLEKATLEISVREFYTELEKKLGIPVSIEAAYKHEVAKKTHYDEKITADELKTIEEDAKKVMKDFKNDVYASYNLPASVGEKTFLNLYFGLNNKKDLISQYYKVNKRSELFLKDMAINLKQNNSDYYTTLENYSKKFYDAYFNTEVGHILVYTDINLDGTPDNPEFYTAEEKVKYNQIALDLQSYFYSESKRLVGKINNSLKYLAEEFSKANKFNATCYKTSEGTCQEEKTYGDLKKQGVFVKYESLGAISLDNFSSYDEKFILKVKDLIVKALKETDDYDDEQEYISNVSTLEDLALTNFGYHLIVLSKVDNKKDLTSKYTKDNDYGNSFGEIKYDDNETPINAYSDTEYLSRNQIEIYMREKDLSGGIRNLPTKVKDACEKFISPVVTKYNSSENQYFIKLSILTNLDFTSADNEKLFAKFKDSLVNQFYGYPLLDKHTSSPLGTWFADNYNYTIGGTN